MDLINRVKSFNFFLFIYFISLPFVFFSTVSDPFLLTRQLLTTVLLFIIFLFLIVNKKINDYFIIDKLVILFIGFISFGIISISKSNIYELSNVILSKYILFFLFFIIIRHLLVKKLVDLNKIIIAIIIFGLISISIATLAFTNKTINNQNLFVNVHNITGTFGNKNFLSSILFFCIPFYFIGLLMSKKVRFISFVAIIITVVLLILLRTRVVLIALSVYFLLVFIHEIKNRFSKKIGRWLLVVFITTISSVIYFFSCIKTNFSDFPETTSMYFKRLFSSYTLLSRVEYWKQSIYMIQDNFLSGVGLGNWMIAYPKYGLYNFQDSSIINSRTIIANPHNDFLHVFSEIGLFGFLCYLGLFFIIIYQAIILTKNKVNPTEKKKVIYLLFFVFCYLIIAFFDFPLSRIEHQILLMVVFSIVSSKYLLSRETKIYKLSPYLFFTFFFSFLTYIIIITASAISGEKHIAKALDLEKKLDYETSILEFKKANTSFSIIDTYGFPNDWHIAKETYYKENFEESLEYFKNAYKRNPYNIIIINDLASTYIKNNDTKNAIKHYKEALNISPNYEDARINLAATYFNIGEYNTAFETIDKCSIDTNNENYKQFLTKIIEKKLNMTLVKINNPELNRGIVEKIKNENDLQQFYFESKKKQTTFDYFITNYK